MSKYKNRKTLVDNLWFDSQFEAERYRELKLMEQHGVIRDLKLQPRFELLPAFRDNEGKKHRRVEYVADFSYVEDDGQIPIAVVEDTKGFKTADYKIKEKFFRFQYPHIKFVEVER